MKIAYSYFPLHRQQLYCGDKCDYRCAIQKQLTGSHTDSGCFKITNMTKINNAMVTFSPNHMPDFWNSCDFLHPFVFGILDDFNDVSICLLNITYICWRNEVWRVLLFHFKFLLDMVHG